MQKGADLNMFSWPPLLQVFHKVLYLDLFLLLSTSIFPRSVSHRPAKLIHGMHNKDLFMTFTLMITDDILQVPTGSVQLGQYFDLPGGHQMRLAPPCPTALTLKCCGCRLLPGAKRS
eukprot:1029513-Pelagomonas_calceolata.AAC.2